MARTMRKEVSKEFISDLSKKLSQAGWILDWENPFVTARVDYKCVDEKDDVYEHTFQASTSLALLRKEESLSREFNIVDFYSQARCQKKVRFGGFNSVENPEGEIYESVQVDFFMDGPGDIHDFTSYIYDLFTRLVDVREEDENILDDFFNPKSS